MPDEEAVPMIDEQPGELDCESVDTVNRIWANEESISLALKSIITLMPRCPHCHRDICYKFAFKWIQFMAQNIAGPGGVMNMFMVMVERNGGKLEFSQDELETIRASDKIASVGTARKENGDLMVFFFDPERQIIYDDASQGQNDDDDIKKMEDVTEWPM